MWIRRLWLHQFRCIEDADLAPSAGLNVIVGCNGAGKSSVLEAISVAASGRSFRTQKPDELSRSGQSLQMLAEVCSGGELSRIGVQRQLKRWLVRVDGQPVRSFVDVADRLAVEVFEPNSHEIVSGGGESRRRFLDWGVFHVEHSFGAAWARYQRGLRQRNVLLRSGGATRRSLAPWDHELDVSGTELSDARERFVERFQPVLEQQLAQLAPELGQPELRFRRGWSAGSLRDALSDSLERDLVLGHTSRGPHRADWSLRFAVVGSRELWSRGQQKIAVFGLCRAMLDLYTQQRGQPAVACLDDIFSELDLRHQRLCLESLATSGAQVWLTGTAPSPALAAWKGDCQMFHVEQGRVTPGDWLTL